MSDLKREVWVLEHNGDPVACSLECRFRPVNGFTARRYVPAEIEQAGKAQGWIPVEERLPDGGRIVLAFDAATGERMLVWRDRDSPVWFPSAGLARPLAADITHWMPLPAPPTKAKEGT